MAMSPDEKQRYRELQQQFADVTTDQRRAIVRAVNRGQPVENRRHAPLAVMIAQRQIRFWRWAWLIAPALGIGQLFVAEPQVALMNGLFGTMVLGTLAWFWMRRARQSMDANAALQKGRIGPPSRSERTADPVDADDASTPPANPRPPAPRGRKRRDRRQP